MMSLSSHALLFGKKKKMSPENSNYFLAQVIHFAPKMLIFKGAWRHYHGRVQGLRSSAAAGFLFMIWKKNV